MKIHEAPQRSAEWYAAHIGVPSASMFGSLVTPTGKPSTAKKGIHTYAVTLANEIALNEAEPDGFDGNSWTQRGQEMENPAVCWYEFITDNVVKEVGFITEEKNGWEAGASPDGLVGIDGLVEIKCLKAVNHTAAFMEYHRTGEAPNVYIAQTQGQMLITGRTWVDLVFFHDRLDPFIVRQTPNPDLVKVIEAQLVAVCTERDEILAAMNGSVND
jgi:hypothetical protein